MSRVTRKLRILVVAGVVSGMTVLGFAPAALADERADGPLDGVGFCVAGVGNCKAK